MKRCREKYEKAGRNARRMPIPVISVGNITAGGTGKTPCILKLAEMLHKRGIIRPFSPAVIKADWKKSEELYLTDDLCGFPRNWREMSLI